jgi:hypothetical protein
MTFIGRMALLLTALLPAAAAQSLPTSRPASQPTDPNAAPSAPDMVLLYYCHDANGPRDWTPEQLRYYLGYYRQRGTDDEQLVAPFFDTVLWMYRISSRKHLFETSAQAEPTTKPDWDECLDRLFESGKQLHALEAAAANLEHRLGRPASVRVVLTLPYPDVRIAQWDPASSDPNNDFRTNDAARLAAVQGYIQRALQRFSAAHFAHLQLLGFYWFNEGHTNLRDHAQAPPDAPRSDLALIRQVARYIHTQQVDGRPLTLTWIPYSPYGLERLNVVTALLQAPPAERIDFLMVQPNYFFARHKKERADLVRLVRNTATVPCGVEVEFDESVTRDETARQRLRDYLEVINAEHPRWPAMPAGYYQGVRGVYQLATRPELAPLYDALYDFVRRHRAAL